MRLLLLTCWQRGSPNENLPRAPKGLGGPANKDPPSPPVFSRSNAVSTERPKTRRAVLVFVSVNCGSTAECLRSRSTAVLPDSHCTSLSAANRGFAHVVALWRHNAACAALWSHETNRNTDWLSEKRLGRPENSQHGAPLGAPLGAHCSERCVKLPNKRCVNFLKSYLHYFISTCFNIRVQN